VLSKSQAKTFFLAFTLICSLVFLWLTIDSMGKIPAQTKSQNLTPQVIAGKRLWESNNCMGCHTIFGEGAYYAPELTKVVDRRGAEWIKLFLKDSRAMFPNERKMNKYNFTPEQIDNIVAFLSWAGEVDLNGFPAKPPYQNANVANVSSSAQLAAANQPTTFKNICIACHSVAGQGGNVGPALDTVYQRMDKQQVTSWLKNPPAVKPGTLMPKLPLTDAEINQLADYLLSFGGK
jgi:nitric oxide reductase subunit C